MLIETQTTEMVVLVDTNGNPVGEAEKMEAHRSPLLHKAFSVIIFNKKGETLIHQRAFSKYHSPGVWTNACCSHPRPKEKLIDAVHRRMKEELGFDCEMKEQFSFVYKFQDSKTQLWEHEHDTVFTGTYDGEIPFNPEEINAVKWILPNDLDKWINDSPNDFSFWYQIIHKELRDRGVFLVSP